MSRQKRSEGIKAQMHAGTDRLTELREREAGLKVELEKANAFYLGEGMGIEEAMRAEHSHALVARLIGSLENDQLRLEKDLAAALAVEEREGTVAAMKRDVSLRHKSAERLTAARKAVNDAVTELLAATAEHDELRTDFLGHFGSLVPSFNPDSPKQLFNAKYPDPQRDAVMDGLERAGVSREDVDFMLSAQTLFETLEHESVISAALTYQKRMEFAAAEQARLRRKDETAAKRQAAEQEAAIKLEEEQKLKAVKQKRGWRMTG